MTVNAEKVLNYLKGVYPTPVTKAKMAEDLGFSVSTVTGTINSLEKAGRATHTVEAVVEAEATETRKAKVKNVMWHLLTEDGLAFDPVADAKEKAEAAAAEKAAKKAAKEAAKAAKEASDE